MKIYNSLFLFPMPCLHSFIPNAYWLWRQHQQNKQHNKINNKQNTVTGDDDKGAREHENSFFSFCTSPVDPLNRYFPLLSGRASEYGAGLSSPLLLQGNVTNWETVSYLIPVIGLFRSRYSLSCSFVRSLVQIGTVYQGIGSQCLPLSFSQIFQILSLFFLAPVPPTS